MNSTPSDDIQPSNYPKGMYIRNPNATTRAEQKEPDIHTQTEKILFKSRIFLSDSEMTVVGYPIQMSY
jgi:hypothetical protein